MSYEQENIIYHCVKRNIEKRREHIRKQLMTIRYLIFFCNSGKNGSHFPGTNTYSTTHSSNLLLFYLHTRSTCPQTIASTISYAHTAKPDTQRNRLSGFRVKTPFVHYFDEKLTTIFLVKNCCKKFKRTFDKPDFHCFS